MPNRDWWEKGSLVILAFLSPKDPFERNDVWFITLVYASMLVGMVFWNFSKTIHWCYGSNQWSTGMASTTLFAQAPLLFQIVHLSLALTAILNMKFDNSFCVIGLLCSSFVAINAGTHLRSLINPLGDESRSHVRLGNCLASRTLAWRYDFPVHRFSCIVSPENNIWYTVILLTCFSGW